MKKRFLALGLSAIMLSLSVVTAPVSVAAAKSFTEQLTEAPMLKDKVAKKELPAVAERMPKREDIMVEPVMEETGKYGGQLQYAWKGPDDRWTPGYITEESMFRFKQDGTGVEPNVAKAKAVNADSTEFTIYLREGMKWSDGMPFTADDVLFYWEHMLIPQTFGKSLYDCYYSTNIQTGKKTRAEVSKVNDYTVKVKFQDPSPLFLERMAIDNKWFYAPAHYYKTVLPEYIGRDKALEVAKSYGFKDVETLGVQTGYYYWLYPERPTVRAWVTKNKPTETRVVYERNPYYWKVDPKGQQLPYIDSISFNLYQNDNQILMEAIAGKISTRIFGAADFTMLKENEKKGDYRLLQWNKAALSSTSFQLNQTVNDPKMRAVFQDIRFREALSVAANREEISEICYNGLAKPAQAAIREGMPNYQKGWAEKWVEYDPDRAKKLLDEMGMKVSDKTKFRTYSDGTDFALTINYKPSSSAADVKLVELLKKYFEAVGIKVDVKPQDDGFYTENVRGNNHISSPVSTDLLRVAFRPDNVVPLRTLTEWYGFYGKYNETKGAQGVKPEGDIQALLDNWNNLVGAKSAADVQKYGDAIMALHAKNVWIIGFTEPVPDYLLAKNNLKNVPAGLTNCDELRGISNARPAQFFFK